MSGAARQKLAALSTAEDQSLSKRLIWVMVLRVALTSVLLGATMVLNYSSSKGFTEPSPRFLLWMIAVTYSMTIIYSVWHRVGRGVRMLATVQLAVDLVGWGALSYATGGIASGFTFLFDLWVIVAAVLLGGRAALFSAGGASLVLGVLTWALSSGFVQPLPDQLATELTTQETVYFLGVNVVALFVVGVLVSSMVSRLERTGRGLEVERARREELAVQHSDVIRSLTVGLVTVGPDSNVIEMNPAGLEILGLKASDVEDQPVGNWLEDVERLFPEGMTTTRAQGKARRESGEEIPVDLNVAPLLRPDGTQRGSIVVFSDVSEVKRLEAALERSRRLAALGELGASLAHEIRNPLGAVSGSVQLLGQSAFQAQEDVALLEIITRETQRMEQLVNDILEFVRPRRPELQMVDLGRLISEVVRSFRMDPKLGDRQVELQLDGELRAELDQVQIRQVLWNLLSNAAQAAPADSTILVRAVIVDGRALLRVADSGRGVAEHARKRIFDPFFSTRERGLGLGLALCKRIAENHGGEIEVLNRDGGGAEFTFSFPARSADDRPGAPGS